MRTKRLFIAGIALVVVGVVGILVISSGGMLATRPGNSPVDRGKFIFRTGDDPNGRAIPTSNGMMMRASCASCHGTAGQGLRTPMFTSPNITYQNLTDPRGMLEPNGSRGPTYTEEQIKRAITQGIDAEGQSLNWPMPRWQMTDQELNDLLAYLKTLP